MASTRRLAAILAADVVGYSRLMGADEEGTLAALKSIRRELGDPKVKEHRGRIVKTTGDGLLIEFASVVDAVRCAVEVQREMAERNADVPPDRRIEFRMGINLGDIIKDGRDIYGDGVNVAARLETLAEPGGICVSRVVRDQVRDKLAFAFEDMGEQQVKNIARPVRVHRIRLFEEEAFPTVRPSDRATALAVPDKPSVAVLPFTNMSGDPDHEFLADGIAEDVITALSRYPSLFVIARNSCFTYKGRAVDVKQVGRDLGVRYVLEGSLRKAGNRIRVTAQLVEAQTGNHVWAERYDRDLADIFTVQDEITAGLRSRPRRLLAGALACVAWRRGARDPCLQSRGVAGASPGKDRPARHRTAEARVLGVAAWRTGPLQHGARAHDCRRGRQAAKPRARLLGGRTHADCEPDKVHPCPTGHSHLQTNPAQGGRPSCNRAHPGGGTAATKHAGRAAARHGTAGLCCQPDQRD